MKKTITRRAAFTTLLDNIDKISEDLTTYTRNDIAEVLKAEIAAMDRRNAERKPSKTQRENAEILPKIVEVIAEADRPMQVAEIAEALNISGAKVAALAAKLIEAGQIERIPAKGKQKVSYKLAA